MEKTDLFDFSFVDRDHEKRIFDNFISNSNKEILWISGKRGVGKSQFIKYMLNQNKQYRFVYYEIKNKSKSEDNLIGFIEELQKVDTYSFCDFLQKEYKSFYNILTKNTVKITKAFSTNISIAVSAILDISNYVITKRKERREPIDIITKYIDKLLLKNSLFICIDNFSKCNEDIILLFCNMFKIFCDNQKCKLCIITTDCDITDEIKLKIKENISSQPIEIEKFQNYRYFWEIMDPIFDLNDFTDKDIQYICSKCKGKPHNLSIVISKLLEKHGILCNASRKKALIDKSKLQEVLEAESIHYNESNFTAFQKVILFSFLCLYEGVNIQTVKELTMFVSERNILYAGFTEKRFQEELIELVEQNKLNSDGETLYTCHDSDYIDYIDIFKQSKLYQIISQNAYEFLIQHKALCEREDLISRHMYEARIEGWKEKNYSYGEKLFYKHLYFDADKYFSNLLNESDFLNECQLLLIAINKYHVGYFNLATNILNKINIEKLDDTIQKYNLLFYLGKSIYNYSGDVSKAISKLEKALDYVPQDSEEYVNVKNLLQMLYIELPGKYANALNIFNDIRYNYKMSQPNAWASTMRGCHNFIHDNDAALEVLKEAYDCTSDELEHAYIGTTMGFVYARSGDLNMAKKCFEKAYKEIKEIKRHESSYAANNLAICYMIENKYLEAKKILLDALFWNRTNYGKIVLNVHLMICETFLVNSLEADRYFDFLAYYIKNNNVQDEIMLRKICLNLAIASNELGKPMQFKYYMNKAKDYVKDTSSEWRYQVIQGIAGDQTPKNTYYSYAKFDPWFLVYAHD